MPDHSTKATLAPSASFVHLHVHTEYSLLDGAIVAKQLMAKCKELGMPAVAMTDHGNLYGAIEFYQAANAAGIKPIMGCEVYVAPDKLSIKKETPGRRNATHLVLLAENEVGWHNLMKLVTIGHLDGFYYKPRVDYATLRQYKEGIIALTGCIGGVVNEWLVQGQEEKARAALQNLVDIFGKKHLFVEMQNHNDPIQLAVIPKLASLAEEFDLDLVATNDAHFLTRSDHRAHDALLCIGTGKLLSDAKRLRYSTEVYLKSPQEMCAIFADYPQACANTIKIANRCNVNLKLDATSAEKYPQFDSPDGSPREEYIQSLCLKGLEEKYGKERIKNEPELTQRLEYELGVINQLGFASYFLITADFISWAREQDIPVGPGRGSAAGSLVAYTMGITDICPIRYGLLFERFLNPERVSPPDVDIDFCQTRRPEVIDYVRKKYGNRSVSSIITYGTLGAKSVIRDVARVMNLPYAEADRLAKMIEAVPGVTLADEYAKKIELRSAIEQNDTYKELWEYAIKLEGLVRGVGVHAAGVVIGDNDLDNHVPLTLDKEGSVLSQFDMGAITEVGLLKMDFLGLKNLTVIKEAVNLIAQHLPGFDINTVPLNDAKTFDLLNRGETLGVFQMESAGFVKACKQYGFDKIDDIIDLLALYRPGAMSFMDEMIRVKRGEITAQYEHPLLEQVSADTYGVMIYQEQVQNAAKLLAGYTLGGADVLRRAMGKKNEAEMRKQLDSFIQGAWETNQIEEPLARQIFAKIQKFAGYGFNKSHSACYGHISYWTAYLKANHPVEFLCGLMSNESGNIEKLGLLVLEANRMGIEILPPHLNKSHINFTPEALPNGRTGIRFGLSCVKNVGEAAMTTLIEQRTKMGPFSSLEDVCNRLDSKTANKKYLESLVRSGTLDWTLEARSSLFSRIDSALAGAAQIHRDKLTGQGSLFDFTDDIFTNSMQAKNIVIETEWSKEQRLADERELLGCYFSGHPLDAMRKELEKDKYLPIAAIPSLDENELQERHTVAGLIREATEKVSKKGQKFATLTIEDLTGAKEVMLWGKAYDNAKKTDNMLEVGNFVSIKVGIRIDDRTGDRGLSGGAMALLNKSARRGGNASKHIMLELSTTKHDSATLEHIKSILVKHPGKTTVYFAIRNGLGNTAYITLHKKYFVTLNQELECLLSPFLV